MAYPVENLFRKPVEVLAAGTSFGAAIALLVLYSTGYGVSWPTTVSTSLLLLAWAGFRAWQGYKLVRFQLGLRWLPSYELTSAEIPGDRRELFLGLGFWWDQRHTQRLYQARLPSNRHLRARNDLYQWAREFERLHPASRLARLTSSKSRWNPVSPLPPVGGDPAIHGVEPNEQRIFSPQSERVGHMVVLGTTRVGKTRFAEILITQDIRAGKVVIVFDPKGDVALLKRMYVECVRNGRQRDFWFFHLGFPELSDRYSPISSIGRITEVATRVANPLPGEGNSAAFKQFAWLYVNIIARAASALGMTPTYTLVYQYAADLDGLAERYFEQWLNQDHPEWREEMLKTMSGVSDKLLQSKLQQSGRTLNVIQFLELLQSTGWHDPIADGLASVLANSKTKYQALINSLFPLLEKLTTGKVSELLSPNYEDLTDRRRIFDWDKIMATGGVVYVGLDSLSDHEVAAAVGNAMFADLTSTAGRRYKFGVGAGQSQAVDVAGAVPVAVHADEFNELIGDEFIPMLNKAGGAQYEVTVYTQTWADVEAKIGNRAKAEQIGGNLNSMVMLRVKNVTTAELLTDQLPMVEIPSVTMVSGANDSIDVDRGDFSANAQDRVTTREVTTLSPSDLVQLPKGQAFGLLEGGQLCKLRLPLPKPDTDIPWPANLEAVFAPMQELYSRYVASVDDKLPVDFAGVTADDLVVEGKGHGY